MLRHSGGRGTYLLSCLTCWYLDLRVRSKCLAASERMWTGSLSLSSALALLHMEARDNQGATRKPPLYLLPKKLFSQLRVGSSFTSSTPTVHLAWNNVPPPLFSPPYRHMKSPILDLNVECSWSHAAFCFLFILQSGAFTLFHV